MKDKPPIILLIVILNNEPQFALTHSMGYETGLASVKLLIKGVIVSPEFLIINHFLFSIAGAACITEQAGQMWCSKEQWCWSQQPLPGFFSLGFISYFCLEFFSLPIFFFFSSSYPSLSSFLPFLHLICFCWYRLYFLFLLCLWLPPLSLYLLLWGHVG